MKINKTTLALMSSAAVIAIGMGSISNVSAMGGHGGGQGGGGQMSQYVTDDEKAKIQSLSGEEREAYRDELKAKYNISSNGSGQGQGKGQRGGQGNAKQSGHNEDPATLIADIPSADLTDTEIELLINQYGEERMARDIYTYAAEKYPNINTFSNIATSEQKHMDTLQVLLDRYNIDAPSDYAKDNDLYLQLKEMVEKDEKSAIEAGILIEITDINNIANDIKSTDNDDYKVILVNIGGASYNHLRGFINALSNNGYSTEIDYSEFLSDDDLNTRGPIKSKLAEKLEAEGVSLPEQASSEALKERCGNNTEHSDMSGTSNKGGQNKGKRNNVGVTGNSDTYTTKIAEQKSLVESKYGSVLDKLDNEKLEALVEKIDALIEKVKTGNYSQSTKEKYIPLLLALKEASLERLDNTDDIDIDGLLN